MIRTIYDRIDEAIRPRSALVAVQHPRTNPIEPAAFSIFECELRTGGRVREIDLVERAHQLKLLEPFESPIPYWTVHPRG